MIPPDDQFILPDFFIPLLEVYHILHRCISGIDSSFGTLNRQRKGIHDDESSIFDLANHQTHDLVLSSGSSVYDLRTKVQVRICLLSSLKRRMTDHLDQGNSRDLDLFEIRWAARFADLSALAASRVWDISHDLLLLPWLLVQQLHLLCAIVLVEFIVGRQRLQSETLIQRTSILRGLRCERTCTSLLMSKLFCATSMLVV